MDSIVDICSLTRPANQDTNVPLTAEQKDQMIAAAPEKVAELLDAGATGVDGLAALDAPALAELCDALGPEAFHRLVAQFVEDTVGSLDEIRRAHGNADIRRVQAEAHRLKGLFAQFGATAAAEAALSLERSDSVDVDAHVALLEARGRAAIAALQARSIP